MQSEGRKLRRRLQIEKRKLETKKRLAGAASEPPPVADPTAPGHRVRPTSSPRAARRAVWNLSTMLAIDTLVSVQGRSVEQRIALDKRLREERALLARELREIRARATADLREATDRLLDVLEKVSPR